MFKSLGIVLELEDNMVHEDHIGSQNELEKMVIIGGPTKPIAFYSMQTN